MHTVRTPYTHLYDFDVPLPISKTTETALNVRTENPHYDLRQRNITLYISFRAASLANEHCNGEKQ
ncbi:MAG TPA: hypothetical protein VEC36_00745 [Patescibacteria group bacterium]|nr:hypothetical protein [Patescibacteria group bacterium]